MLPPRYFCGCCLPKVQVVSESEFEDRHGTRLRLGQRVTVEGDGLKREKAVVTCMKPFQVKLDRSGGMRSVSESMQLKPRYCCGCCPRKPKHVESPAVGNHHGTQHVESTSTTKQVGAGETGHPGTPMAAPGQVAETTRAKQKAEMKPGVDSSSCKDKPAVERKLAGKGVDTSPQETTTQVNTGQNHNGFNFCIGEQVTVTGGGWNGEVAVIDCVEPLCKVKIAGNEGTYIVNSAMQLKPRHRRRSKSRRASKPVEGGNSNSGLADTGITQTAAQIDPKQLQAATTLIQSGTKLSEVAGILRIETEALEAAMGTAAKGNTVAQDQFKQRSPKKLQPISQQNDEQK